MNLGHLGLPGLCVTDAEEAATIRDAAVQSEQQVKPVNLREASTSEEIINELGSALSFPDYFGRNWDAVDECLQDLSWIQGSEVVVFVLDADRLLNSDCLTTINFVRTLARASKAWKARNLNFRIVFVGSKPLFNTVDAILRPL